MIRLIMALVTFGTVTTPWHSIATFSDVETCEVQRQHILESKLAVAEPLALCVPETGFVNPINQGHKK